MNYRYPSFSPRKITKDGDSRAIQLFAHNEKSVPAGDIHAGELRQSGYCSPPAGTGKSYIAFKHIEGRPYEWVVRLSPSEYIFKTKTRNLRKEDPDFLLQNAAFLTYARLMQMDEDEIAFAEAQSHQYKGKHGNLTIPAKYKISDGNWRYH